MRVVSAVCRLGAQVGFVMAWFWDHRLHPVLEWLWRRLGLMRCWIVAIFCPILGYALVKLGWRKDPGTGRGEAESSCQWSDCECEGQHEAAGKERTAGSDILTEDEEEEEGRGEPTYQEDGDELSGKKYGVEATDELYCGYDSTWDTEENQEWTFKSTRRPAGSRSFKFSRFESAARDMQNYRHDYPVQSQWWGKSGSADDKPNLKFYLGLKPSMPDGVYITNFHEDWAGDYDTLEYIHTYIQWLFPLQEPGMNNEASPLTKEEIAGFLENSNAKENLLKSYKLMLDFYGIELCSEETGEVQRALNWRDRFKNLNNHTHNNLRITRILKCLGTLGYAHYQAPLVHFFLEETLVRGELPNVKDSVLNYFVFAVLDKKQRRSLIRYAYLNYDRQDEFVWCPKKIQVMWSRLSPAQAAKVNDWSL